MSDDGVGVRLAQLLDERYRFPPGVTILDGGTLGLDLLHYLEGKDRLVIVDAMETGGPPGTIVRLTGDEIPVAFETKLSPHQMGLKDLLAVSRLQGTAPSEMVLFGVQPQCLELGMELSPAVEAGLAPLAEMVLRELARWGVFPESATGGPVDSGNH